MQNTELREVLHLVAGTFPGYISVVRRSFTNLPLKNSNPSISNIKDKTDMGPAYTFNLHSNAGFN